jgi:hypothetical protein
MRAAEAAPVLDRIGTRLAELEQRALPKSVLSSTAADSTPGTRLPENAAGVWTNSEGARPAVAQMRFGEHWQRLWHHASECGRSPASSGTRAPCGTNVKHGVRGYGVIANQATSRR